MNVDTTVVGTTNIGTTNVITNVGTTVEERPFRARKLGRLCGL